MIIDQEFKDLIPPLSEEEFKGLENEIKKDGCRDSLMVWGDILVDGHNRYEICTRLGISYNIIQKEFQDRRDAKLWIIANQFSRRNLSAYDRSVLALKYEELYKEKAKERMLAGVKIDPSQKSDEGGRVTEQMGKLVDVSRDTILKVKKLEEMATPEQKQSIRKGDESINSIYTNLVKKEKREEIVKKIQETPVIDGKKKYGIIYADPAWKYFEGGNKNQSQHYKTMTMDEIKALPVQDFAAEDCVLFIWVTFPILPECFDVIRAWGFEYSTCGFTWVKKNPKSESWFFGLGQWTRSNAELCLIATKGHLMRKSASVSQIIDAPVQEHSRKPDIVRDKIVELMGDDIPKIEMFARQQVDGWDNWGMEVPEGEQ